MKLLLPLILISWHQIGINAQTCSSPTVSQSRVFIYRSPSTVEVVTCLYKDRNNNPQNDYYDITNYCVIASRNNVFIDKYGETHFIGTSSSQVTIQKYQAEADLLSNSIWLRSGTKCRYDQGFCYDRKESVIYAVTWNVQPIPTTPCSNNLEQIFYGNVDTWDFVTEHRKYLFYTVPRTDESFALSLKNSITCRNQQAWYTDQKGYIVSFKSLLPKIVPTPVLNKKLFPPLKSKTEVSAAVIRDCNLKSHDFDFDIKIDDEYLKDWEALKIILMFYQTTLYNNKEAIEELQKDLRNIQNSGNNNNQSPVYELEIDTLKSSLDNMQKNINDLFNKIKYLQENNTDISGKVTNLLDNTEDLKNSITKLDLNDKFLTKQIDQLKSDLKMKIYDFNKNLADSVKSEIIKLNPTIENDVINALKSRLDSLNDSGIENIAMIYLNKPFSKIEQNITNKLNPIINSLNKNCNIILNQLEQLKHNFDDSIKKINEELKQCTLDQDFKTLNNTLFLKLLSTDNSIKQLTDELKTLKQYSETTKNDTELKLQKAVDNIANTLPNFKINIEEEFSKKINPLINKIDKCTVDTDEIKNIINNTVVDLTHEIRQGDNDIYKQLSEVNRTVSQNITNSDINLKNLENVFNRYKNDVENKQLINDNNFKTFIARLNALTSSVDQIRSDIDARITNAVSDGLDNLDKRLTLQINLSQKRIANLEDFLKDFKQFAATTVANEGDLKKIKTDLMDSQKNLNNLQNRIVNIITPTLNTAVSKSNNCDKEVQDLKTEISDLKKIIKDLRKDHDTYNEAFEQIIPGFNAKY